MVGEFICVDIFRRGDKTHASVICFQVLVKSCQEKWTLVQEALWNSKRMSHVVTKWIFGTRGSFNVLKEVTCCDYVVYVCLYSTYAWGFPVLWSHSQPNINLYITVSSRRAHFTWSWDKTDRFVSDRSVLMYGVAGGKATGHERIRHLFHNFAE